MHQKQMEGDQQRECICFSSSFKSDTELNLMGTILWMIHIPIRPLPGTGSKGKTMIDENTFFSSKTLTLFWLSVLAAIKYSNGLVEDQ